MYVWRWLCDLFPLPFPRELAVGREEFERLERERKEAQKEKEEVISKLQAQERIVSEAQQEKDLLKGRIQQMEQMVRLHCLT